MTPEERKIKKQEWEKSEKGKETRRKYLELQKGKAYLKKKQQKAKDKFPFGRVRCLECGSVYDKIVAVDKGYKMIGRFTVICC